MITIDNCKSSNVLKTLLTMQGKIDTHKNIAVSVSGGADSDIVVDLMTQCTGNIEYIFFDTGIEYNATKRHLEYLEDKYKIQIKRLKAQQTIPIIVKKYGQPFFSKRVSEYMSRLQVHNFTWEIDSFEYLYGQYPNCKAALRWWCNKWGENSTLNIEYTKGLREFIHDNPPQFKISNKCCEKVKKHVAQEYCENNNIDLQITGIRKSEGGPRKTINTCYVTGDKYDKYYPLYWWKNDDKFYYENENRIVHSECYGQYGLKRTGCAGCPYGANCEYEQSVLYRYEPKLYNAVSTIFKDSYEYTRQCKEYRKQYFNIGR